MGSKQRVEIAVIGASSAGLLAATLLAQQGLEVVVFEQQRRFRPCRRTLIVTPALYRVLPWDPEPAVLHHTPWMTVATEDQEVTIKLQEPDVIIERQALLYWLWEKAQQAGVRVQTGCRLAQVRLQREGLQLFLQQARGSGIQVEVRRALLAADGVFSDTVRALGLPRPPAIPIVQAEVSLPKGWDPGRTQVWFLPQETRYFYWLIPESPDRGVVGLMTDAGVNPGPRLRAFLQRMGLAPMAFQGARVALYHPQVPGYRRIGQVELLVLGDAAGHVKNTTVGGTVTGFRAARAAVQVLAHGIPWAEAARDLYRELRLHWWIRRALHHFPQQAYRRLLTALTPELRSFLGRRTRDEMAPVLWPQLLRSPSLWRLLPTALRSWLYTFPPGDRLRP